MSTVDKVPELRVSGKTPPHKLGGAIVKYLDEVPKIVLLSMGDAAVSQAVKGVIVAQSFLASSALDFNIKMGFRNSVDSAEGNEITAVAFVLTRNW